MGILRVLSRRGDDRVTWEAPVAVAPLAADAEACAAVLEAERIFRLQQKRGATAFRLEKGQAPVRVDKFESDAQEIVMVPRVVGG